MKRLWLVTTLPLLVATALSWSTLSAPAASAYGYTAQWQIGISFNCNNPNFCGPDLGGFWGWAEFDGDGTADAQLVDCGHLQGGPAPGAQHFAADVTGSPDSPGWFIAPSTGAAGVPPGFPEFWITNEIDTITGRHGGPPIVLVNPNPPYPSEMGVPAVAGHYDTVFFLGFQPPPGVSFTVQVVRLHH